MSVVQLMPVNSIELPDPAYCGVSTFSGPRYTSYPTADRFVEAFDAPTFIMA